MTNVKAAEISPAMTIMPGFYRDPVKANRIADAFWGKTVLTTHQVEDLVAYVVTRQKRVNYCREIHMDRFPLTPGHDDRVALETFVRSRARGEAGNVPGRRRHGAADRAGWVAV